MSLLREIQDAAIDPKADILVALRKCRVLASRLSNEPLKLWVQQELDGYCDADKLPDYRVIDVQSLGHFSGPFGRELRNAPIPASCIPEEYQDRVTQLQLSKGIGEIAAMASDKEGVRFSWPADFCAFVGRNVYEGMNLLQAFQPVSRSTLIGIIETVRNRVLQFALEIEAEAPSAGEAPPNSKPIPDEKVTQVFNHYILGNVGNLASGGSDFSQSTNQQIVSGDWKGLKQALESSGISETEITELKTALDTDGHPSSSKTFGKMVSSWIGKMIGKAANGAWNISADIATKLLTRSITQYYGLPLDS